MPWTNSEALGYNNAAAPMKIPRLNIGPTGRFPRGRADETDEGELKLAITTDKANGIVRLIFGKQVTWIGLPVGEARQLAQMLLETADEIERSKALATDRASRIFQTSPRRQSPRYWLRRGTTCARRSA